MKTLLTLLKWTLVAAGGLLTGLTLYALPAALTPPPGRRPGLADLTLDQAAQQLKARGLRGLDLVEAAPVLVGERLPYSRRKSFQPARLAFCRGGAEAVGQAMVAAFRQAGVPARHWALRVAQQGYQLRGLHG